MELRRHKIERWMLLVMGVGVWIVLAMLVAFGSFSATAIFY